MTGRIILLSVLAVLILTGCGKKDLVNKSSQDLSEVISEPVSDSEEPADFYYYEETEFFVDIDGDSKEERLCQITNGGDGHTELYVHKFTDTGEKIGFVNWLKLDIEDLYYWGCNAVYTGYDKASGEIKISYCPRDENAEHHKEIYSDFSIIEYCDWDGETLPGIDQEEAFERYGNL